MSRIVKVASWPGKPRASVVFVHGLGGHVYDTWRRAADDNTFWPVWLAQDVEGLAVYSLAYEAPVSNWLGTSMPLQDRAVIGALKPPIYSLAVVHCSNSGRKRRKPARYQRGLSRSGR